MLRMSESIENAGDGSVTLSGRVDRLASPPIVLREATLARFWAEVKKGDGCWLWQGLVNPYGYGRFWASELNKTTTVGAHKVAFQITHRRLDPDEVVMHKCDVRLCVNPAHLTAGTTTDNNRDMHAKRRSWQASTTHCPHGHAYTPENTVMREGRRYCRECGRIWTLARRHSNAPRHRKEISYAIGKADGILYEIAVPRSKADAATHRRVGPFGKGRWARKSVPLDVVERDYEPKPSDYDTKQLGAQLSQCIGCLRSFYFTQQPAPARCIACRTDALIAFAKGER